MLSLSLLVPMTEHFCTASLAFLVHIKLILFSNMNYDSISKHTWMLCFCLYKYQKWQTLEKVENHVPKWAGRSGVYPCVYCGSVQESQAFSTGSQLVKGTIGTWLCDKARKTILATLAVSAHSSHCFQALPFVFSWGAAWLSDCHGLSGPELVCCFSP